MNLKRLRLTLVGLICFLIADILFVAYEYNKTALKRMWTTAVVQTKSVEKTDRINISKYIEQRLKELDRKDKVYSRQFADWMFQPSALRQAISSARSLPPEATSKVVLIKTHKTGSSTIQNILLRFAILHNLTIAVPRYQASFLWPSQFIPQFIKEQKGVDRYDVLVHHAIFSKPEMDMVMKPGAIYITILRNPITLFKSAFKYYLMEKVTCFGVPLERFWTSLRYDQIQAKGVCPGTGMPASNLQALDLGIKAKEARSNATDIPSRIRHLDENLFLVMITERFDESLVLLGRKMHWQLDELVYFTQNAQDKSLSLEHQLGQGSDEEELNRHIAELNTVDQIIYDYFKQKLDRELAKEFTPEQLASKVEKLRSLRGDYMSTCVQYKTSNPLEFQGLYAPFRPYGARTLGYMLQPSALNNMSCRLLAMPELGYTAYLKHYAQNRAKDKF